VVELPGRIGDTAPQLGAPLDQGDADIGGAAQQMSRQQHAAGATADDKDGEAWMRFVHACFLLGLVTTQNVPIETSVLS